ncbi:hypothetical protein JTE90_008917, partial [Oedothorax gibbosus]
TQIVVYRSRVQCTSTVLGQCDTRCSTTVASQVLSTRCAHSVPLCEPLKSVCSGFPKFYQDKTLQEEGIVQLL